MRKKIILFTSVFSIFLFVMIPHIPALQYSMVQNEYQNGIIRFIPENQKAISPSYKISLSKSEIKNEIIQTI